MIRTLPKSWEHMRIFLTHNDNIRTFDKVARHLEMEEDRLLDEKITPEANIASSSQHITYGSRRKRGHDDSVNRRSAKKAVGPAPQKANDGGKKKKFPRGTRGGKKVKAQKAGACFTCGKVGHFARDCTEQKEPRNT